MRRANATAGVRRGVLCALLASTIAYAADAQEEASDFQKLQRQVEALMDQNRTMEATIQRLEDDVRDARDEARSAHRGATAGAGGLPAVGSAAAAQPQEDGALLSMPIGGRANLQLLDISLDIQTAAGWSTAPDSVLVDLQGGDHDPRNRGFTLQAVELSFAPIAQADPADLKLAGHRLVLYLKVVSASS